MENLAVATNITIKLKLHHIQRSTVFLVTREEVATSVQSISKDFGVNMLAHLDRQNLPKYQRDLFQSLIPKNQTEK